jgi:hypothetical protein
MVNNSTECLSHRHNIVDILYTGRSYKDEQYLPCLWREGNHKLGKRTLQASQLYTQYNRILAF